jgi:hypothetical protein
MSNDQNQNRGAGAVSRAQPKTPLERAQQIQEMQRQMDAQPTTTQAPQTQTPAAQVNQASPAKEVAVQKAVETFEVKAPEPVAVITGPQTQGADQLGYGATQVDEAALFGLGGGNQLEVTGNPWKIIPFGDPPERQLAPILDLKKPVGEHMFDVPMKSIKLKQGHLFEIGVKPKDSKEPLKRQAVIVDSKGVLKGAEFKNAKSLEQGLAGLPGFALSLFQQVFGEGLGKDDPERMKVKSVAVGKKSSYEAVLTYRNPLDGKTTEKKVALNNFGMRVAESSDPKRFDIITRMYRLDSFEAAPKA